MTTVSHSSRQNDASLRAFNVVLRENLVLVLVLVLESKGPFQSNYSDQSQQEQTARWTDQNFSPETCSKHGNNRPLKARLVLVLLLMGWKNGARFLSQSISVEIAIVRLLRHSFENCSNETHTKHYTVHYRPLTPPPWVLNLQFRSWIWTPFLRAVVTLDSRSCPVEWWSKTAKNVNMKEISII